MVNPSFLQPPDEPLPVLFRTQAYRTRKRFSDGGHRSCSPEETLERIRPHLLHFGVTRIANVTGLDRVGIPVTIATRPNGASLSVTSGKGLTLVAAKVSGAMEAIEVHCAENLALPEFSCSYDRLRQEYPVIAQEDLPLRRGAIFHTARPERWILGWDIVGQQEIPVPAISSTMDFRHVHRARELASFTMDSNGLASGNTFLEAVSSALFELVERDAMSCYYLYSKLTGKAPPVVDPDTIGSAQVQEVLDRIRAVGLTLTIYDYTIDTQIPVYVAQLDDKTTCSPIAKGYGCHLDAQVALLRALTEAAQGRLVYISGTRDDLWPNYYSATRTTHNVSNTRQLVPGVVQLPIQQTRATSSFEGDIHRVIENLQRVGLDQVIVLDLSPEVGGVHVVRVFVPGLEVSFTEDYPSGRRARAFCAAHQADLQHSHRTAPAQAFYLPAGGAA